MKTRITGLAIILAALSMLTLNSCKEEILQPVITLSELGLDNSKVAYIGADLHIEAEIVAEGTINTVVVEIHPEGTATWEFDTTYTEFAGLKNTTFHKHIEIPHTAEAGDYHFHLVVTDNEGNQITSEAELSIEQPTDDEAPGITVNTAPTNGQVFTNGETISISGTVTDNIRLGGIYIGLVGVDQDLEDSQVNADNTITLLHFHDFENPVFYDFNASIVVGAANDNDLTPDPATWTPGNYYLVVKSPDAYGGNVAFSAHYPIEIQ
jgi:hypothetical protein